MIFPECEECCHNEVCKIKEHVDTIKELIGKTDFSVDIQVSVHCPHELVIGRDI